ncbi:putative O-succinylbenzoic acid--CoA ligase [Gleimia coleocanis DSM 15436]|uniref:Putative O-succinylbenzoic acid--CoA ligase n=1 Tax=Gleimia coleocanis DSM 15436 TaxID=525245 RepID=C0W0R6_9ACTO|nr:AMP-binding protein [Gleimia coleocanis]EEH63640.1 putative O-succinylbenzoic acid--CoA ligase [Gleimia coleocanis DSM 15436]
MTISDAQLMLVPGGTSAMAITRTYSAVHKLWEFFEREEATGQKRSKWIVVAPRPIEECFPPMIEASTAALENHLTRLPAEVDVIVETSGSTSGQPRLVGLSYAALVASARATHEALGGPGRWIVALPVHHIAGLLTLVRCCVAEASPVIAELDGGFDADALIRACRSMFEGGGVRTDLRSYLALVPKQLQDALDFGGELVEYLARLDAILVGGAALPVALRERAETAGLRVVTSYGMTETAGGVVYDGVPLAGVRVETAENGCALIHSPTLLVDYLDGETGADFVSVDGLRFLPTADQIISEGGKVQVQGRADEVIISGGLNISPLPVANALVSTTVSSEASVTEAVVLPAADSLWGQIAVAVVTVAQPVVDLPATARHWRELVGSELGKEFAPRAFIVLETLPRTDLGKPDKHALEKMVQELLELPAELRPANLWVKENKERA